MSKLTEEMRQLKDEMVKGKWEIDVLLQYHLSRRAQLLERLKKKALLSRSKTIELEQEVEWSNQRVTHLRMFQKEIEQQKRERFVACLIERLNYIETLIEQKNFKRGLKEVEQYRLTWTEQAGSEGADLNPAELLRRFHLIQTGRHVGSIWQEPALFEAIPCFEHHKSNRQCVLL